MKKYFIILVLLVFAIFISGCINISLTPEDDSIAPGRGRLKIYLTDFSGNYKENDSGTYVAVNITISEIKVHLAGDDEENEGEWIEGILTEETEYNLIELEDVSVLLSEGELASGKYTQIRLFITEASVSIEKEEETGAEDNKDIIVYETFDVEIPSNLQTGLKLIHPFEINGDENTVLTIDFDAEKSIIKTGNGDNEKYILKPVIKVITG